MARGERGERVTSIAVRVSTLEALKPLKFRDFGAEESWDHLLLRARSALEFARSHPDLVAPEVLA